MRHPHKASCPASSLQLTKGQGLRGAVGASPRPAVSPFPRGWFLLRRHLEPLTAGVQRLRPEEVGPRGEGQRSQVTAGGMARRTVGRDCRQADTWVSVADHLGDRWWVGGMGKPGKDTSGEVGRCVQEGQWGQWVPGAAPREGQLLRPRDSQPVG